MVSSHSFKWKPGCVGGKDGGGVAFPLYHCSCKTQNPALKAKGNVCWRLGERGRWRVLPAVVQWLRSPFPVPANPPPPACLLPSPGVTAAFARAPTERHRRDEGERVAVGAAGRSLRSLNFVPFVLRHEHPSSLRPLPRCLNPCLKLKVFPTPTSDFKNQTGARR